MNPVHDLGRSNNVSDLLPCEVAMGLIRGREIQELVEESTGRPCPCRLGHACPLEPYVDGLADARVTVPRQGSPGD